MEKNEKYEQLMRWILNDIPKDRKIKYDIGWNIMHLDIFCVINSGKDMIDFISDVEHRLGQPGRFLQKS